MKNIRDTCRATAILARSLPRLLAAARPALRSASCRTIEPLPLNRVLHQIQILFVLMTGNAPDIDIGREGGGVRHRVDVKDTVDDGDAQAVVDPIARSAMRSNPACAPAFAPLLQRKLGHGSLCDEEYPRYLPSHCDFGALLAAPLSCS